MADKNRRLIHKILRGRTTLEGAGVKLKRIFGFNEVPEFDPFLLLDDFGSENPEEYLAGFPWHPHRGIETVTYMLHGVVRHGDSLGNAGEIAGGQVQWMTAGGGIVHQEMPQRQPDFLRGLQLWVNLPAARKMMPPRYRDIRAADIPEVTNSDGGSVRVIAGRHENARGPVKDIVVEPTYLDVSLPPGGHFRHDVEGGHKAFVYILSGEGIFDDRGTHLDEGRLGLYGDGKALDVQAGRSGMRFLCVSGKPIGEPVAWRGPIVMNTRQELDRAFEEYRMGTFISPSASRA